LPVLQIEEMMIREGVAKFFAEKLCNFMASEGRIAYRLFRDLMFHAQDNERKKCHKYQLFLEKLNSNTLKSV
jgi:hypothetical protein